MGEWFVLAFSFKNLRTAMFKVVEIKEYNSDGRYYDKRKILLFYILMFFGFYILTLWRRNFLLNVSTPCI